MSEIYFKTRRAVLSGSKRGISGWGTVVLLPLVFVFAAACSDRSLDKDIVAVFERHSYEEHPQWELVDLLRSKGFDGLKSLDKYAEIVRSARRVKEMSGDGNLSSGLLIRERNGLFYIPKVFQNTPAAEAGLKDGDRITEIDGVKPNEAAILWQMRSLNGFKLKVERPFFVREGKPREEITADVKKRGFSFPALFGFFDPIPAVAYVKVGLFGNGSAAALLSGLDVMARFGAKSVVFDLRGNGAGVLEETAAILKAFAPGPGPVFHIKSRHKNYCRTYEAPGRGKFAALKIAVLVDADTSVSAEVFASALRELRGAAVIGRPTRGSVSVRKTFRLGKTKTGLTLTVARMFPPSGADIEGKGVEPDLAIDAAAAEEFRHLWLAGSETALLGDPAYNKAVELLRK